ncbi:MAG: 50S ribosomal protein L23 [Nanoarchaeota archaeon]|nr:50S ribosomal protein L23 [Nanoarchaeota archaeon]
MTRQHTSSGVVKNPISTEKVMGLMQNENKLVFVVEKKAQKKQIKDELEKSFKIKIIKVNTVITPQGIKKAYVTLAKENPAIDVATELGLM